MVDYKIEYNKEFEKKLLDNNFNMTYLLKKHGLRDDLNIYNIPNSGSEKVRFNLFRKDVTQILATTVNDYIKEFGGLLKLDMDVCVIKQLEEQRKDCYTNPQKKYFLMSTVAPHTRFSSFLYKEDVKKQSRGIKNFVSDNEYLLDVSKAKEYNFSAIYYLDQTKALQYLFSKFGKIKKRSRITAKKNIIEKKKQKEGNNTIVTLEQKVSPNSNCEMSDKEFLKRYDLSEEEFKQYKKERDELFKKNGNGWWITQDTSR